MVPADGKAPVVDSGVTLEHEAVNLSTTSSTSAKITSDRGSSLLSSLLSPENTMDAFAIACANRLNNAGGGFVSAPATTVRTGQAKNTASARQKETPKAPTSASSKGPLLKGQLEIRLTQRSLTVHSCTLAPRTGLACLSCKARRVKCDGMKPACSSCTRNARWEGRCPETAHGCVYRADLPQKPVPLPAGYMVPPPKGQFGKVEPPTLPLPVLPVLPILPLLDKHTSDLIPASSPLLQLHKVKREEEDTDITELVEMPSPVTDVPVFASKPMPPVLPMLPVRPSGELNGAGRAFPVQATQFHVLPQPHHYIPSGTHPIRHDPCLLSARVTLSPRRVEQASLLLYLNHRCHPRHCRLTARLTPSTVTICYPSATLRCHTHRRTFGTACTWKI